MKEADMRVIIPTLIGLAVWPATSAQAAPALTKTHAKSHETPAQNVRKSQQYDYLLSANAGFLSYRMKKECEPIKDPGLRANCIGSFSVYEPR
jgi:hypothetical protein